MRLAAVRTGEPTGVVVGAGAAGSDGRDLRRRRAAARCSCWRATDRPGQKILISGGGRCNVLPSRASRGRFSHRWLAQHAAQDPRGLAAGRGPPLLRGGASRCRSSSRRRAGSSFLPRTGRGRCSMHCSARHRPRGVDLRLDAQGVAACERRGWVAGQAGVGRAIWPQAGSCWRPAGCRCRRPAATARGCASRRTLGHTIVPTYPALDAADDSIEAHKAPGRRFAPGGPGERAAARRQGQPGLPRRLPASPTAVTAGRPCLTSRTCRCAPRSPADRGRPIYVQWTRSGAGRLGRMRCAAGSAVLGVLRRHLPERLAVRTA